MATGASDIRAGGAYIEVGPDLKRLQSSLKQAKSKLDKFANTVSSVFTRLATVGGLSIFGRSVLRAASDLEKAEVRFSAAFGKMEDSTRDWIKQMSAASGLGEGTLMGMMADANALGRNLGFADDQAAEMSKTMARLSADVAAHFGDDIANVASRMQMALMGSSRSMRDYNVSVTEQAARAELMKRGLIGANEAMSEQQKVLGRLYGLITQTADAQGAATGATSTWAVAVMRFKEMWTDLKETIGTPMLEIFMPIVRGITGVVRKMRDWIGANPEFIQGIMKLGGRIIAIIASIKAGFAALAAFAIHRFTAMTDHVRDTIVWAGNKISSGFGDSLGDLYDKSVHIADLISDVFTNAGKYVLAEMKILGVRFVSFMQSEVGMNIQDAMYNTMLPALRLAAQINRPWAWREAGEEFDRKFPKATGGGRPSGPNAATAARLAELQEQAAAARARLGQSGRDLLSELGWDFGDTPRPTPPDMGKMGPAEGLPGEPLEPPTLPAGGVGSFLGMRRASEMMGFGRPDMERQQLDTQKSMLGVLESIRDNNAMGAVLA